MYTAARLIVGVPILIAIALVPAASGQDLGPEGAVGTMEERLQSRISFDADGVFSPGQGFTAHVRPP